MCRRTSKELKYACRKLNVPDKPGFFSFKFVSQKVDLLNYPNFLRKINSGEFRKEKIRTPDEVKEPFSQMLNRWLYNLTHRKTKRCKCGNTVSSDGISFGMIWNSYWHFECSECLRILD